MKVKHEIVTTAGSLMFKFLLCTWRFKKINFKPELYPAIYAIFHGWQCTLGGIPDRKDLNVLISLSRDGEMIAGIAEKLGFSTIRGSKGRGGMRATLEILKTLKKGKNIAYTVDGPRGPGFVAKEGVIKIAQMSKRPIIPVFGDASFRLEINSWDNYQFPLPFAKIPLHFGEPIFVPEGEENVEPYRQMLENELLKFKNEARRK